MLLHAARRGTAASLVARQRAAAASVGAAAGGPMATTRSLVSGTAGTQKKRPLNVGQLKGNQATGPPASAGAAKAAAPKPDPPAATSAASKPDAGAAAASAGSAKAAASGGGGGGGGGGLLIGFLGLGGAGVGAAYYYDMIDFDSLTGSPIKEEKKWEIIKQAKEDAEEAKKMEEIAKKEMEAAAAASAASAADDAAGEASKADTAAAAEVSAETKTEEADKVASADDADSGAGVESSEANTSADRGNRVTTIVVPPIDEENRPPQVVPANPEHPPNANKVTGLPFGGDADAAAGGSGGSASAEELAQREHALVSAEEAAKEIASAAEGETEAKLRAAHKSLRADLDESYLADLDSLGERELRIRVVQLASEMDERTKWEAVRLKEFLSMKEKETAEK